MAIQQVYTTFHKEFGGDALTVAANVRSFLPLPDPLPPPKTLPNADPQMFQRLDHTFTPRQWLSTVRTCRSKLHTGFPSDHYLLVTEIQIRLAAKVPKRPRKPVLHYDNSPENRTNFNAILADMLDDPESVPDHNAAPSREGGTFTVYTDGSGSSGKCGKYTPAGWGFCFHHNGEWRDFWGPVTTTPHHPSYRGAQVGSNNTGELTAIIEAIMYAHQQGWSTVHIRSDSQWAINVITGKWRASSHKTLVNVAKQLQKHKAVRVYLHWIKGHAGHEGNERADHNANEGRQSATRHGTSAIAPELEQRKTVGLTTDTPFSSLLKEAAQQTFPRQQRQAARPWITQSTLEALDRARKLEATQDHNAKQARNQAKRSARKDRVQWIHARLQEDYSQEGRGMWKVVRQQKKGFQGRKRHLIVNDKPVPWSQTHLAFRSHLEQQQWKQHTSTTEALEELRGRRYLRPQLPDHNAFSLEELQAAILKLKPRKAPGPDETPNELFRLLDDENTLKLLEFYNDVWEKGEVPVDWKEAIVISLYKGKGADTSPENYRPISLLNSIYKVFASMLQIRLSAQHDHNLRETQYGFRKHKSTTNPLFILRRAIEWSEMTSHPLSLLFLDWKQAFDSVDHNALLIALTRFGLSKRSLNIISSLYQDPTFYTLSDTGDKAYGTVGSGIRQGCPLSPYLFIMVQTVIFEDLDWYLLNKGVATNTWSVGKPVYDLVYADDTLLMSMTTTKLTEMLHGLEIQAKLYGMNLNHNKTEILQDSRRPQSTIRFRDGTPVQTTWEA